MSAESVQLSAQVNATETLALGNELSGSPKFAHRSTIGDNVALSTTSTPPISAVWSNSHALVGVKDTLVLTALPKTGLTAVDLTGKRLRAVKLAAHEDNLGSITVEPASATPYAAFPTIVLGPGEVAVLYFPSAKKAVVGAGEGLDISGTIAESVDIVLVAG